MLNDAKQLEVIIADTKKLINLAEKGEWDAVVELEKKRGSAVEALFKSPPNIEPSTLSEGLQFIVEKNKILSKYSHSQRDSIRMEMSKAGHAHKAINAYLKT